jgi:hypothetical protein
MLVKAWEKIGKICDMCAEPESFDDIAEEPPQMDGLWFGESSNF